MTDSLERCEACDSYDIERDHYFEEEYNRLSLAYECNDCGMASVFFDITLKQSKHYWILKKQNEIMKEGLENYIKEERDRALKQGCALVSCYGTRALKHVAELE